MKKILLSILLCISLFFLPVMQLQANAFSTVPFVLLTQYEMTLNVGEEFQIFAITHNGSMPTFKSSDSKIASVNTYGEITAKSAGTAKITAKINKAEASCKIIVRKTTIDILASKNSIEASESLALSAKTSTGNSVTWKCTPKSVAVIDENGNVTGLKPGKAVITATADKTSSTFSLTVKSPKITLNRTSLSLYRSQTFSLTADVSSKLTPTWKSNKKSIVTVDENGNVTALKHGVAIITATLSGISKSCTVTVKQPEITLDAYEITIKKGNSNKINAKVSSGNLPTWSTSNPNIVTVDVKGNVTGVQKGRAYIYAAEDGIKMRCTVYVTE
ncbi:MAG: hypothetical protein K0R05_2726 [Anaerocolumna sp.]|nr:hypothetical protein [Anaerocolumna sp.]